MGYLLNDKETREAFNEDNWLRLGEKDVGYVDDDGFNVFLGRPRNYITLKSGEVICPNRLEQLVRLELPCVKHAMIVGDGEEWLAVLLTLRTRPSLGVHGQQTQYDRLTPLWIVRFVRIFLGNLTLCVLPWLLGKNVLATPAYKKPLNRLD